MPSPELKPCPFCGGKAALVEAPSIYAHHASYSVACDACGNSTAWHSSEHGAVAAWNRRAGEDTK